jgi:hypothetical protein
MNPKSKNEPGKKPLHRFDEPEIDEESGRNPFYKADEL